ncbi:MAG: malonate-semialdehyde dehydrogenase (acetylating)/methylmalonate-semialdehyde dehydrogenase, partial [Gammaproteobacteria bacterium]
MSAVGQDAPSSGSKQICHFIDGKSVEGTSQRGGKVYNPATGEITAQTPLATAAEVETAIASAQAAFPAWSATPVGKRAQLMFAYREKIVQHMDELAEILSSEHGKTIDDAKGEITRGLEVVEFACGIPQLLKGEYNQSVANGVDTWSMRQPLGVVGGITPFNFPAMIPLWMFPVAIACGNTFVLKPSERDPSTGIRLAELFLEAGAPPGVLNVINGDKEAVDTILSDP